MNLRWIATTMGMGAALSAGCSLFVGLDGLSGGTDAGVSANDAAADQSSVTSDASSDSGVDAPISYEDAVLADHPLAYFRFDETSGTEAADSSGNGHDGHYKNGFSLGATGAFSGSGTAVHLLGSAFVQIDDSVSDAGTPFDFAEEAPFTFETWVSIDAQPVEDSTEFTLFSKEKEVATDNFHGIDFFLQPHFTLQREDDPGDETEANSGAGLGSTAQWYYVVGVFDGTTITIYVDLTSVATHDSASTHLPVTLVPMILGAEDTAGDNGLLGLMDEAAVYDHALTTEQLAAHFHAAGR